jgi:hypothetical protein
MMIDYRSLVEDKSVAKDLLEKMKKYEQTVKMHEVRIDDKTIVYCKNEDRIEQYKKLK